MTFSQKLLKGNSNLLFTRNNIVKEEAISRLCWILSTDTDARDMLPRLHNLRHKTLTSICELKFPLDINKVRNGHQFYQVCCPVIKNHNY